MLQFSLCCYIHFDGVTLQAIVKKLFLFLSFLLSSFWNHLFYFYFAILLVSSHFICFSLYYFRSSEERERRKAFGQRIKEKSCIQSDLLSSFISSHHFWLSLWENGTKKNNRWKNNLKQNGFVIVSVVAI